MLNYFLYKIGEFLALHLPEKIAYMLGLFLSDLQYYISKKDRDAVINNLKIILPNEKPEVIKQKAREVFRNFGIYLVEFFRSPKIDAKYIDRFISFEGIDYLKNILKQTGAILLTAHIGNWELGGMVLSLLGFRSIAIALDHSFGKVNNFFINRRKEKGIEVIPLGIAVRRCFHGLKEKKLVAILGDRDFSNSSYEVAFLGRTKKIPRGPAVLAKKANVPIVPAFAIRKKLNYLTIKVLAPIYVRPNESDIEIIKRFVKVIEEQIYQYPTQWLMFREFWKE